MTNTVQFNSVELNVDRMINLTVYLINGGVLRHLNNKLTCELSTSTVNLFFPDLHQHVEGSSAETEV